MKQFRKMCVVFAIMGTLVIGLSSCKSKPKDSELITKAQAILPSGVSIDVKKGVATLTGEFKDDIAKQDAENALKAIPGIKSVQDNATITPVQISADDTLKSQVNNIIKNYAGVNVDVKDGIVTLNGELKRDNLQKLMQEVQALHPKKVENKLILK